MSSERTPPRVVAFFGPDGAGKSTLLKLVEERLSEGGGDARTYYFAPGFLERYRPKVEPTVTTNPHEGRQYPALLVAAKIALMLFEFRMGVPQVRRRNRLVLFDRFIHDLLIDPRRYRMGRSRWWMRAALRLAPRPDLAVVVVAPPEVIQRRKQEVSLQETARQVAAYRDAARLFPRMLVVENTGAPEDAARRILAEVSGS